MSIPIWPTELPQRPLREGFSIAPADGRLSTKPDKGPPIVRRQFSSAIRPVSLVIETDLDGIGRFDRFWAEDTAGGSLPFIFPDPRFDGIGLGSSQGAQLLGSDGAPLLISARWLVLFAERPPEATNRAGRIWRQAFQLSVMP